MSKDVFIKVNARHVGQLGRELVTDYVTALVELIKNSYDADAEGVKIEFEDILSGEGRITIIDSGSGLSQNDVINKWAVIGTNSKIREIYSPKYKRKYAGKKGIGRFAVERLGEHCTIYSFTAKEKPFKYCINWNAFEGINITEFKQRIEILKDHNDISSAKYIKVLIEYLLGNDKVEDRDKDIINQDILAGKKLSYKLFLDNPLLLLGFEKTLLRILEQYRFEEKRIDEIATRIDDSDSNDIDKYKEMLENYYVELEKDKAELTGSIIVLDYLRDDWKERDIRKVKKELLLLVAPKIIDEDAFKISLIAKDFNIDDAQLTNEILNLSYAKVDCKLFNGGTNFEIKYWDKDIGEQIIPEEISKKKCGDFSATIYYFLRDSNLKSESFKANLAKNILDTYCGIKIYRDGFRVRPYGEPGNDWLLLDHKKIRDTHGYLVGNNQVIGVIDLSETTNPLMIDATNREAIIENDAFDELKELIKTVVNKISNERMKRYLAEIDKKNIDKKDEDEAIQSEKRANDAEETIKTANEAIINKDTKTALNKVKQLADLLEQERESKEEHYRDTKAVYEEQLRHKDAELNLYKNLASLGILAGTFGHETNGVISRITNDLGTTKQLTSLYCNDKGIGSIIERMENDAFRVQGYSTLIVSFLKKHKRELREKQDFKKIISDVIEYYKSIIQSYNIKVDLNNLESFESCIDMFQIDVESIIINMFTNSFEALKTKSDKKIKISTLFNEDEQQIIFEDSGVGIPPEKREWVFTALNTTKDEDGVGLGLTIVKDIVSKYGGEIVIDDSKELGGAKFIITFDMEVYND